MKPLTLVFLYLFLYTFSLSLAQQPGKWGDQGDGTYLNPILTGDFQNTDVIRVGPDYYYISATKELSPGMAILTSKDLVNWKIIGHAVPDITQISPNYNYDKMQGTSRGIWAGAISYHDGKFYVYFTDPDVGIYMTSATDPAGPWKPLTVLLKSPGWDDPCPLWEDDPLIPEARQRAYLVTTNFADNYKIHLFKMTPDGEKLIMESDQVIHQSKGSEANKLYKINNFYYHFYSEVTPEGRMPFMARSININGPYTERRQLIHKAESEPNQGGLVQTVNGDWYFVTHHGKAHWDGRQASLLPVTWLYGWPVWGTPGKDTIGNMIWAAKKPVSSSTVKPLQTSDEFKDKTLSPQWEWYFQPRADKWSLTERPGFLRLYAGKQLQPGALNKTPDVLTQRPLRTDWNEATVRMEISRMADGQMAGLCLFGKTSGIIGVQQNGRERQLYYNDSGKIIPGPALKGSSKSIWLRSVWDAAGRAHFFCSTDGNNFTSLGSNYQITNFGNFLGAKLGVFTANNKQEAGFIDIDWFHYNFK